MFQIKMDKLVNFLKKRPKIKPKVAVECGPLAANIFGTAEQAKRRLANKKFAKLEAIVIPQEDMVLSVVWGCLGRQLIDAGIIDAEKFENL